MGGEEVLKREDSREGKLFSRAREYSSLSVFSLFPF